VGGGLSTGSKNSGQAGSIGDEGIRNYNKYCNGLKVGKGSHKRCSTTV